MTFAETDGNAGGVSADHQHIAVVVTQQGRITHLKIPGSLAVTRNLGCVALDRIDNSVRPPDLYDAVPADVCKMRYDIMN